MDTQDAINKRNRALAGEGSIYVTHRKGGRSDRWTAEWNWRGVKIRKSSIRKEVCEEWLNNVRATASVLCQESLQMESAMRDVFEKRLREVQKTNDERIINIMRSIRDEADDRVRLDSTEPMTYIAIDNKTGLYKIGKTVDLFHRRMQLNNEGNDLDYLAYRKDNIEGFLHYMLDDKNVIREGENEHREWFALTDDEAYQIIDDYHFVRL